MSLRIRFLLLLGIIGVTVTILAGSAFWSFTLMRREVVAPFQSTANILSGLSTIKRGLETQATTLLNPAPSEIDRTQETITAQGVRGLRWTPPGAIPNTEDRAAYAEQAESIRLMIRAIEQDRWFTQRVGAVTATSLRQRTYGSLNRGLDWYDHEDSEARTRAVNEMFDLHEMIELIEARILDDAGLAIAYTNRLQNRLLVIIGLSLILALVMSGLSYVLFRRWITVPVLRLRTAAVQIGAGDFGHRIPIVGRDELADLSHEVNEMASTILVMQEERVDRERLAATGELIRQLSHNLRNPLAGIRGVAEVTSRKLPEDSPLSENLNRIITSVDRLDLWLRDLLDSTSPVTVASETHEVGRWLTQVAAAHQPMADHKSVELILDLADAPHTAVFDRRRLEQAITGIVTNAIQATPSDGTVTIKSDAVRESAHWRIIISDTGPGIDPELHQQIFKAHFTTKPDGSGIGLAAAMQVVRAHGGTLGVSNDAENGQSGAGARSGAIFTIRLPLLSGAHKSER